MNRDIYEKALRLIANCQTCLVGSLDRDGYPAVRAMLKPRETAGMNNIIFSTNTSSNHVAEFSADPRASVYFYDPNLFQGLLLRGKMRATRDQDIRNRIWQDGDNLYYQLGPTDPDYSAMLFTAEQGRWYEEFTSTSFAL